MEVNRWRKISSAIGSGIRLPKSSSDTVNTPCRCHLRKLNDPGVQAILTGKSNGNVVIRPGDMIYVPDPKQPSNFDPLVLLQGAALLFGL